MGELSHAPDGRRSARWASQPRRAFSRGYTRARRASISPTGQHSCPMGTRMSTAPPPQGVTTRACLSFVRTPAQAWRLDARGGDSTHSVPCRFPGVLSRKHACWMSGSPEARVAPEASGIGESSRSRLKSKHTLSSCPLSWSLRKVTSVLVTFCSSSRSRLFSRTPSASPSRRLSISITTHKSQRNPAATQRIIIIGAHDEKTNDAIGTY